MLVYQWFEEIRNFRTHRIHAKLPYTVALELVQTHSTLQCWSPCNSNRIETFKTHQTHLKLPNSAGLLVVRTWRQKMIYKMKIQRKSGKRKDSVVEWKKTKSVRLDPRQPSVNAFAPTCLLVTHWQKKRSRQHLLGWGKDLEKASQNRKGSWMQQFPGDTGGLPTTCHVYQRWKTSLFSS